MYPTYRNRKQHTAHSRHDSSQPQLSTHIWTIWMIKYLTPRLPHGFDVPAHMLVRINLSHVQWYQHVYEPGAYIGHVGRYFILNIPLVY
jgi:hypothetical protein